MASIVAEIEKAVQNKYLSEELNIETKLHHLCLGPHNRVECDQRNPEEERNKENQAALKRNRDLLKETDLVVARYRSRSLYSPVDGHLQACKLLYLKRLKELKHKEQLRRFRTPPQLESTNDFGGVAEQSSSAAGTSKVVATAGILRNPSRPSAYLVTGSASPIPFPRTTLGFSRKLMSDSDSVPRGRGALSTPVSAGLFRNVGEPLTGALQPQTRYRHVRSTPGSAGASRTSTGASRSSAEASSVSAGTTKGLAGTEAQEPESSRPLVSKPV